MTERQRLNDQTEVLDDLNAVPISPTDEQQTVSPTNGNLPDLNAIIDTIIQGNGSEAEEDNVPVFENPWEKFSSGYDEPDLTAEPSPTTGRKTTSGRINIRRDGTELHD